MVAPACGQQRWSLFFFERTTVMSFTEGCFYRTYVFAFTDETPVSHDSCCEADGLHLVGVALVSWPKTPTLNAEAESF